MPSWLIFAILQPAILTVVNFTDKYILSKDIRDYKGFVIFMTIVSFIVGTLLWIVTGFPVLNLKDTLLVLSVGILLLIGSLSYYKVMSEHDASKVIFMFQAQPVFVLILSVIFLNESLSAKEGLGFLIILLATVVASLMGSEGINFKAYRPLLLIVAADLLWAASSVLFKFLTDSHSFASLISYESWGLSIAGGSLFLLFPSIRNAFLTSIRSFRKQTLAVVFGNELVYVVSRLIGYFAVSLGPVTLVNVISGTGVFFGVIYGWILTLLFPTVFNEDTRKKTLSLKFALAAVVVLGIYLIS